MSSKVFGTRKPNWLWQLLISWCHRPDAPLMSKLLAPLARKIILRRRSTLPIDITVNGLNMRCQFTDNYSEKKFVFTPWRYDLKERTLIERELANGGNFIDIGANVGIYTLTAAKALGGNTGRVIAFEPNPETMERLRINIEGNTSFTNGKVELLNFGIADKDTSFTLHIDRSNLGASSISGATVNTEEKTVIIHCRPLLPVLNDLAITSVNVLKIDIEGAEDLALAPFMDMAPDSMLPKFIIIENSEHRWSSDLYQLFESRGYLREYQGPMNSIFTRCT